MRNHRRRLGAACLALGALGLVGCARTARAPVEIEAPPGQIEARAVIGKEGGTLRFAEGGARLEIPAGVLMEEVTVVFKREPATFDLSGKDFLGEAYRVSPRLSFAPGAARLFVPLDKELPGTPEEARLRVYSWAKFTEEGGPEGHTQRENWTPQPLAKLSGYSQDRKHVVFWIYETISDRTTKAPFGLFQAAFDTK
jgi:hypothetical protein